jgi:hypothetical protein
MINEGARKKVLDSLEQQQQHFEVVKNLSLDIKSKSDVFIDVEISYINHC